MLGELLMGALYVEGFAPMIASAFQDPLAFTNRGSSDNLFISPPRGVSLLAGGADLRRVADDAVFDFRTILLRSLLWRPILIDMRIAGKRQSASGAFSSAGNAGKAGAGKRLD